MTYCVSKFILLLLSFTCKVMIFSLLLLLLLQLSIMHQLQNGFGSGSSGGNKGLFVKGSDIMTRNGNKNERLAFFDDFDSHIDNKIWKHDVSLGGGGNKEFQYFTNNRSVSFVRDGVLHIKPKLTEEVLGYSVSSPNGMVLDIWGNSEQDRCTIFGNHGCQRSIDLTHQQILNPVTSARITTFDSFSFKYGRVEARIKLPVGQWLWPVFWMLPRYNAYGSFPASGEIDIVESRGNRNYAHIIQNGGADYFQSVLHWGPSWQANGFELTSARKKCCPSKESSSSTQGADQTSTPRAWGDDFHTYGLYWDEKELYTYVDSEDNRILHIHFNQTFWKREEDAFDRWWSRFGYENPWLSPISESNVAPFDQEFYMIISLAIGGTNGYFPDHPNFPDEKPWQNNVPHGAAMLQFWNSREKWYPSWRMEDSVFKVDWIKVWLLPQSTFSNHIQRGSSSPVLNLENMAQSCSPKNVLPSRLLLILQVSMIVYFMCLLVITNA